MRRICFVIAACLAVSPLLAQDPIKVDSKHYTVVFENERVRVVRITYGPHEKSVMHHHPDSVAVFLSDQSVRFTYPDGKSEVVSGKAKTATWNKSGNHLPENVGEGPLDLILVELKSPPSK